VNLENYRKQILEKLRNFEWLRYDVEYVILFGSILNDKIFRIDSDVDIAIKFRNIKDIDELFDEYVNLLTDLASYLEIPESKIDITVLNDEEISCTLILEIYGSGKLLYIHDLNNYLNDYVRLVGICNDYEISVRKLGIIGIIMERVKKLIGE